LNGISSSLRVAELGMTRQSMAELNAIERPAKLGPGFAVACTI
jgi:hypothetical protein